MTNYYSNPFFSVTYLKLEITFFPNIREKCGLFLFVKKQRGPPYFYQILDRRKYGN